MKRSKRKGDSFDWVFRGILSTRGIFWFVASFWSNTYVGPLVSCSV